MMWKGKVVTVSANRKRRRQRSQNDKLSKSLRPHPIVNLNLVQKKRRRRQAEKRNQKDLKLLLKLHKIKLKNKKRKRKKNLLNPLKRQEDCRSHQEQLASFAHLRKAIYTCLGTSGISFKTIARIMKTQNKILKYSKTQLKLLISHLQANNLLNSSNSNK